MPETSDLLEKSALIFLYNFHREHSWLKSIIKKVIAENQCEKHKNRVYNCFTTGARKMPTEYMFCFIFCEQCIKNISSRKKCGLFGSVFKKNIPKISLPLLFKKWMGKFNPSHFLEGIRTSHRVNGHRID